MGTIQFRSTEELPRTPFNSIPVTNWRTLGVMKDDRLEVVLARFHRFVIHDITLEYFHLINKHRYIDKRSYRYVNNALACSVCHGAGRLDWIQKARNRGSHVMESNRNYRRNPEIISDLLPVSVNSKHEIVRLYGSKPKIFDGQEVCDRCIGTGMESMNISQELYDMED